MLSSSVILQQLKETVAAFSPLDPGQYSKTVSTTIRMLQILVEGVTLEQVLHEAGSNFMDRQAVNPWGRGFSSGSVVGVRALLVRSHPTAVMRTFLVGDTHAELQHDKEVYRFPSVYFSALQFALQATRPFQAAEFPHLPNNGTRHWLAEALVQTGSFRFIPEVQGYP
jgi:hypothetical protein